MSRSHFRQADVAKAVRAVSEAGIGVAAVRIDRDGSFVVFVGKPTEIDLSAKLALNSENGTEEGAAKWDEQLK